MALKRLVKELVATLVGDEEKLARLGAAKSDGNRDSAKLYVQLFLLTMLLGLGLAQLQAKRSNLQEKMQQQQRDAGIAAAGKAQQPEDDEVVAQIHSLYVYPVKSCAPIRLEEAELSYKGFELDRRWCIVRESDGKVVDMKMNPRTAHIQPLLEHSRPAAQHSETEAKKRQQVLRLSVSPQLLQKDPELAAALEEQLSVAIDARPSMAAVETWQVMEVSMWGDTVRARLVPDRCAALQQEDQEAALTPSEWCSRVLGEYVRLVYFDRTEAARRSQRPAWPWYAYADGKSPVGAAAAKNKCDKKEARADDPMGLGWDGAQTRTNEKEFNVAKKRGAHVDVSGPGKGVEFQDEYPLLVATVESMRFVQAQLDDALKGLDASPQTDGHGGPVFPNLAKSLDKRHAPPSVQESLASIPYDEAITQSPDEARWKRTKGDPISIIQFRPNIVLSSSSGTANPLEPFAEEDWEHFTSLGNSGRGVAGEAAAAQINLVAYCERCPMTTIDPITGEKDLAAVPLRLLGRSHIRDKKLRGSSAACFGMYAVPMPVAPGAEEEKEKSGGEEYGTLRVGDAVRARRKQS